MTIIIPGIPRPKPRMTRQDRWLAQKNPARLTYAQKKRVELLNRYREWETTVRAHTRNMDRFNGKLCVCFYLPIPASFSSGQRKKLAGVPHVKKPDLSNLIKGLEDSIFENDQMIHTYIDCRKVYDDGDGPRTVIDF